MATQEDVQAVMYASFVALISFILSFLGWQYSLIGTLATCVLGISVFLLFFRHPVYACALAMAELAMGGMGWWLQITWHGFQLPVRMVLFLSIMAGWGIVELLKQGGIKALGKHIGELLNERNVNTSLFLLGIVVVWGMGWGMMRGNSFEAVLLDANAWWYLLLLFPLLTTMRARAHEWRTVFLIVVGASVATSVLTLFLYHVFVKDYEIAPTLYRWIRDTRLGELTPLFPRGWRVFMQSQVWSFIALGWGIVVSWKVRKHAPHRKPEFSGAGSESQQVIGRGMVHWLLPYAVITLSLIALFLSLSRSYWIGLGVMLITLGIVLYRHHWILVWRVGIRVLMCGVLAYGVIFAAQFTPALGVTGVSVRDRLQIGDAAGSSRMNQLMPLTRGIITHPIIGSGFGTTVMYTSSDPRIVARSPGKTGLYSTYAFEWGYLDIWLKVGLVGLTAYLWLIVQSVRMLWKELFVPRFQESGNPETNSTRQNQMLSVFLPGFTVSAGDDDEKKMMSITLLCAVVALAFVNITSPYLNHPLGIGMIVLTVVFVSLHRLRTGRDHTAQCT